MSLVNDMLKDLDARKSGESATTDSVTADLHPVTRRKPLFGKSTVAPRTWAMIGLAVLLGVGLGFDRLYPRKIAPPVPEVLVMEPDASGVAMPDEAPPAMAASAPSTDDLPHPPQASLPTTTDIPVAPAAPAIAAVKPVEAEKKSVAPVAAPTVGEAKVSPPAGVVAEKPKSDGKVDAKSDAKPESKTASDRGEIKDVAIVREDDRTTVRFIMGKFVTYALSEKKDGRVRLSFRDAKLPTKLPKVVANDTLKHIERGATEKSDFYDIFFADDVVMKSQYVAGEGASAGEIRIALTAAKDKKAVPEGAKDVAAAVVEAVAPKLADVPDAVAKEGAAPASELSLQPSSNLAPPAMPNEDAGERADNLWQTGLTRLRRGDALGGKTALRAALMSEPRHVEARVALVSELMRESRFDEARNVLDEGLRIDPAEPELAIRYARLQVDRGREREAIDALEAAGGRAQGNWDYQTFLAALYQRTGAVGKSADIYRAAVAQYPQRGDWWFGLGLALDSQGKSQSAFSSYERALGDNRLAPALRDFARNRLTQK